MTHPSNTYNMLIMSKIPIGGGKLAHTKPLSSLHRVLRRAIPAGMAALPVAVAVAVVALGVGALVASCGEDDPSGADVPADPTTRTLTHADSVRLGLVISVENDGEWDGEDEYPF